jgi:hypothetical protein
MVVFDLICSNQHSFEGWFASMGEFSRQLETGKLSCPVCHNRKVVKRPSAIHIGRHTGAESGIAKDEATPVSGAAQLAPADMQKMLDYLLEHTDDVGRRFPDEARKIHRGEAVKRGIRGQASRPELEALEDEGIEVMPFPFPAKEDLH